MADFRQLVADLRRAQKLALSKAIKAKPKERNKALGEARRLEAEVDQALPAESGDLADMVRAMRSQQVEFWENRYRMSQSARFDLLKEAKATEASVDALLKPSAEQPSLIDGQAGAQDV